MVSRALNTKPAKYLELVPAGKRFTALINNCKSSSGQFLLPPPPPVVDFSELFVAWRIRASASSFSRLICSFISSIWRIVNKHCLFIYFYILQWHKPLSGIPLSLEFGLCIMYRTETKEVVELNCSSIISLHPVRKFGHSRLGATAEIHHKFTRKLNEHSQGERKTSGQCLC